MRFLTAFLVAATLSLATWTADAEPAQIEQVDGQTRIYLDFHNRSWLAVDQVDLLIVFFDAAGDVCHRELVYLTFGDEERQPVPAQGHREFYITIPDVSRFGVTRIEVDFQY